MKLVWSLLVLAVAVAPVLAAFLVFRGSPSSASMPSYIFYKPSVSHTKIVEATTINGFDRVLFGTSKDLLNQVNDSTFKRCKGATLDAATTRGDQKIEQKTQNHSIKLPLLGTQGKS